MNKLLSKGGNFTLPTKISALAVGLSWEAPNSSFDLDAWTFLLNAEGRVPTDSHFVFFNNKQSPCGSVFVSEDNQMGGSQDEDDEIVTIRLNDVPPSIQKIVFIVNIYQGQRLGQNFGQLDNAAIRLYDPSAPDASAEITRYNLGQGDATNETSLIFGELYRHKGEWKFRAVAQGHQSGPKQLASNFGVEIEKDETESENTDSKSPDSIGGIEQAAAPKTIKPTPVVEISKGKLDLTKPGQAVTIAKTPAMEFSLYWTNSTKDLGLILLVTHKDGSGHAYDWRKLKDKAGEIIHHGDRTRGGSEIREYATLRLRPNTQIAAVAIAAYSEVSNGFGSFKSMGAHAVIDDGNGTQVKVDLNKGGTSSYHAVIATIIVNSDSSLTINRASRFSASGNENRPQIDQYGNLSMNTGEAVFK